jgi:hypothetical protein
MTLNEKMNQDIDQFIQNIDRGYMYESTNRSNHLYVNEFKCWEYVFM